MLRLTLRSFRRPTDAHYLYYTTTHAFHRLCPLRSYTRLIFVTPNPRR